jgi:hypothetical protein
MELNIRICNFLFFESKIGNQANFWQSGKILAIRQDSGNQVKFWQPGKIYVGTNTLIRQQGTIQAIRKDPGNQERSWQSGKILVIWQPSFSK